MVLGFGKGGVVGRRMAGAIAVIISLFEKKCKSINNCPKCNQNRNFSTL
jgi:hypothetical protein